MFTDCTTVRLGDISVRVRRLTLKELREARGDFAQGRDALGDEAVKFVQSHCTVEPGGKPVDPDTLSLPQMRKLVTELVGIPDSAPISDFIGLLC